VARQSRPGSGRSSTWRPAGTRPAPAGRLADYAIGRPINPELVEGPAEVPWDFFPRGSRDRQAGPSSGPGMAAWWGFIHGGDEHRQHGDLRGRPSTTAPCAFMNAYRPGHGGSARSDPRRPAYAYGNQPVIAPVETWARFAEGAAAAPGPEAGEVRSPSPWKSSANTPALVLAVLARRDGARSWGSGPVRGQRRGVDPVAARLDAGVPGRLHQHVSATCSSEGPPGWRPVSGTGLPGLVLADGRTGSVVTAGRTHRTYAGMAGCQPGPCIPRNQPGGGSAFRRRGITTICRYCTGWLTGALGGRMKAGADLGTRNQGPAPPTTATNRTFCGT